MKVKWLMGVLRTSVLALTVSLTISACDKSGASKDAGGEPQVQAVLVAFEAQSKLFECPVPAFMRDRVAAIEINAKVGGEQNTETWAGVFEAHHLDIKLSSGKVTQIEMEEFTFVSTAPDRHEACEQFIFLDMAGRVFFSHGFGVSNPYPAQTVKYLDEDAGQFVSADTMFQNTDAAYLDFDKKGCVSAVVAREPVKAYICFRDGRFAWERKRLGFRIQHKYYSFDCDLTKSPATVLDTEVATPAQPTGLSGPLPIEAIVQMERMCEDFRQSHGERDIPGKSRQVVLPVALPQGQPTQKEADSAPQVTGTDTSTKIPP